MVERIEREGGRAVAVKMNVADEDEVVAAFARIRSELGGFDLLVNNAGLEHPYPLTEMPLDAWRQVLDVNLTGAFLCSREAARIMLADDAKGAIVRSPTSRAPSPGPPPRRRPTSSARRSSSTAG